MFYQTEAKPQGWRAVAVFDDRTDRLLYLGRSSTQVRTSSARRSLKSSTRKNAITSVPSRCSAGTAPRRRPLAAPDESDRTDEGQASSQRRLNQLFRISVCPIRPMGSIGLMGQTATRWNPFPFSQSSPSSRRRSLRARIPLTTDRSFSHNTISHHTTPPARRPAERLNLENEVRGFPDTAG